jgi:hypothetical protein
METESPNSLVFGDFEIAGREDGSLWELGRGAFGVTYLAVDNVLRRKVALKVIDVPAAARTSPLCGNVLREARRLRCSAASECGCHLPVRCFTGRQSLLLRNGVGRGETLEACVRRAVRSNANSLWKLQCKLREH